MKYLIAGLGNVGEEYSDTRHNVGFNIVDQLAKDKEAGFSLDRLAFITDFRHKGRQFYLIKPTTFMNLSGKAVKYWVDKLKIPLENLLVVIDEIALPIGTVRLRAKGSDAGHNGLKSINLALGSTDYARLRFGIGNDFPKGRQVDHVLGRWRDEEWKIVEPKIKIAGEMILSFGILGVARTMTDYNNK